MIYLIIFFLLQSCSNNIKKPDIGKKIHGPTEILTSLNNNYFYILNLNKDDSWESSSLLISNKDGKILNAEKISSIPRTMNIVNGFLLISVDANPKKDDAKLLIFDINDQSKPKLSEEIPLPCNVNNIVAHFSYKYFAMSCFGGKLIVAKFEEKNLKLNLVRDYSSYRSQNIEIGALILDVERETIYGFPSSDSLDLNYNPNVSKDYVNKPKYIRYDIKEGEINNFELKNINLVSAEINDLYFNIDDVGEKNCEKTKCYRSGFSKIIPSNDDDIFYGAYLSNILEISFKDLENKDEKIPLIEKIDFNYIFKGDNLSHRITDLKYVQKDEDLILIGLRNFKSIKHKVPFSTEVYKTNIKSPTNPDDDYRLEEKLNDDLIYGLLSDKEFKYIENENNYLFTNFGILSDKILVSSFTGSLNILNLNFDK